MEELQRFISGGVPRGGGEAEEEDHGIHLLLHAQVGLTAVHSTPLHVHSMPLYVHVGLTACMPYEVAIGPALNSYSVRLPQPSDKG